MRFLNILVAIHILVLSAYAQKKENVQELIESKEKADMTYQEMMQIMSVNAKKIYDGILLENKVMVRDGAQAIRFHKAPKHKPWLIVEKSKQEAFKEMLLIYDEELHESAEDIVDAVDKDDWYGVNKAFGVMTNNCIVCHSGWKKEVVRRNFD